MGKQTYWRALLAAVFWAMLPQWAQAADITVDGTGCTLADAISTANDGNAYGTCTVGSATEADTITLETDVTLAEALPQIASTITIEGVGHTIDADDGNFSVLYVTSDGNLTLNKATITGGSGSSIDSYIVGGGICNDGGTVTLTNSTVSGNSVFFYSLGGGIFNYSGIVTLTNSKVIGNSAGVLGGGIYNDGMLTVTNSTISDNISYSQSSSYSDTYVQPSSLSYGGGIHNSGTVTLTKSTVSGNTNSSTYVSPSTLIHSLYPQGC